MSGDSPILREVNWVIARGPLFTLECLRCGGTHVFETPIKLAAVPFFTRGFQEEHHGCKGPGRVLPGEEGPR